MGRDTATAKANYCGPTPLSLPLLYHYPNQHRYYHYYHHHHLSFHYHYPLYQEIITISTVSWIYHAFISLFNQDRIAQLTSHLETVSALPIQSFLVYDTINCQWRTKIKCSLWYNYDCFSDAVKVRHFIRYFALRRVRIEKNASVIYKLANVFLVQSQTFSFYYSRTSISDHRSQSVLWLVP